MTRIIPALVLRMVDEASSSAGSDVSPFWQSDGEGIPEEGMYRLASELDVRDPDHLLDQLPPGYRIVYSIFEWEQSRAGEGFTTGLHNSGQTLVHVAAASYAEVGMSEEAMALRHMLEQHAKTPLDYDRTEAAYNAVDNPYKDDWDRIPHLVRHLCENADRYFYVEA
ncbi:hypothetical protein QTH89_15980 [Variovorax sp. J22G21]|uniref:DMP19 family protein n=1 Tax=Variovorax fucosicus TaxID=3053517 RepID=UPI002578A548|nr:MULTISPECIES: hypothetical protein [unclassified Variovorax]MDM0037927.1 hypothetical protein [Variovorax sp. J22R193]MDM0062703.1 hypothetical protein [Variovorax sp. J22G21]